MTDDDARLLRQENTILKQRAQIAELKVRCEALQRMHDADQRHITRLQRKLDAGPRVAAEAVFKRAER